MRRAPEWRQARAAVAHQSKSEEGEPRSRLGRDKNITSASYRFDHLWFCRIQFHLATDSCNADVDASVEHLVGPAVRQIKKLFTTENAVGVPREGRQEIEFSGRKHQFGAVRCHEPVCME